MMKIVLVVLLGLFAISSAKPPTFIGRNTGKIVGGVEATPYEFPWIVDMRQGSHYCGGSIFSEEWVVTAAHCSTGSPSAYTLVAGDHDIGVDEGNEQRRQVDRIVVHPGYGSGLQYENDIALMHVSPPFVFNEFVQPVNLPEAGWVAGQEAVVTGWGALSSGGGSPLQLHKVVVPFVDDDTCNVAYTGGIANSMICYGEGGKDSCQGDSGGPILDGPNNGSLVGIVSWGRGCALPGYPGVYTETSYFTAWIRSATIPAEEDPTPVFEQVDTCGGYLEYSSGRINFFAGAQYTANQRCSWTVKVPANTVRFNMVSSGLATGDNLYVTQWDSSTSGPGATTQISQTGTDYLLVGPILLITFSATAAMPGQGFSLEFYSSGFGDGGSLSGYANLQNATGTYSYPVGGGQYGNGENAAFVVNPAGTGSKALTFTRLDVESSSGCIYDVVQVYAWANGNYNNLASFCGSTVPGTFTLPEGLGLVTFSTDSSVTATGFTFQWQ